MKTEIKLIISILNDDHGVSQETWDVMMDWMMTFSPEFSWLVSSRVEATDGRYYVKEGKAQELQDRLEDYIRKTMTEEL
jgi:hypothetical protein